MKYFATLLITILFALGVYATPKIKVKADDVVSIENMPTEKKPQKAWNGSAMIASSPDDLSMKLNGLRICVTKAYFDAHFEIQADE